VRDWGKVHPKIWEEGDIENSGFENRKRSVLENIVLGSEEVRFTLADTTS